MFKKCTLVILSFLLLFSTAGCGLDKSPAAPSAPEKNVPRVFANLEDEYVLLSDAVVESTLPPIAKDGNCPPRVNGEGVLYGDKKSSISVLAETMDATLTVDGVSIPVSLENFLGANIVDLIEGDNFHELALYVDGPSADPSVTFVRFDGKTLTPIINEYKTGSFSYTSAEIYGDFYADEKDVIPTYGAIWTNRKDSIVTSFQQIGFTSPRIALSRFVLSGNTWKEEKLSPKVEGIHEVSETFKTFFTPMENPPVDYGHYSFIQGYDENKMREFKKGDKIEFLGFGEMYGYYTFYIKTGSEKGVLAFWLGD